MKLCKVRYPFIEKDNAAYQEKPVFLWIPKCISGEWIWLEIVTKITKLWGWGFVDIWYKRRWKDNTPVNSMQLEGKGGGFSKDDKISWRNNPNDNDI